MWQISGHIRQGSVVTNMSDNSEHVSQLKSLLGVNDQTALAVLSRYDGDHRKVANDFLECASLEDFMGKLGLNAVRKLPTPRNKSRPEHGHSVAQSAEEEELMLKIAMQQSMLQAQHESQLRAQQEKMVKMGEEVSRLEQEKENMRSQMEEQRKEALDVVIQQQRLTEEATGEAPKFSGPMREALGKSDPKGLSITQELEAKEKAREVLQQRLEKAREENLKPAEMKEIMEQVDAARTDYRKAQEEALRHIQELESNGTAEASMGAVKANLEKDIKKAKDQEGEKEEMEKMYNEVMAEYKKAAEELEKKLADQSGNVAKLRAELLKEQDQNNILKKEKLISDFEEERRKQEEALNAEKQRQQNSLADKLRERRRAAKSRAA